MPFNTHVLGLMHLFLIILCGSIIAVLIGGPFGAVLGFFSGSFINYLMPHPAPEVEVIKHNVEKQVEKLSHDVLFKIFKALLLGFALSICIAVLIGKSSLPYAAGIGSASALINAFLLFPLIARKFLNL